MGRLDELPEIDRKRLAVLRRENILVRKLLRIIEEMEATIADLQRELKQFNCPAHGRLCSDARCDIRDGVSVNIRS